MTCSLEPASFVALYTSDVGQTIAQYQTTKDYHQTIMVCQAIWSRKPDYLYPALYSGFLYTTHKCLNKSWRTQLIDLFKSLELIIQKVVRLFHSHIIKPPKWINIIDYEDHLAFVSFGNKKSIHLNTSSGTWRSSDTYLTASGENLIALVSLNRITICDRALNPIIYKSYPENMICFDLLFTHHCLVCTYREKSSSLTNTPPPPTITFSTLELDSNTTLNIIDITGQGVRELTATPQGFALRQVGFVILYMLSKAKDSVSIHELGRLTQPGSIIFDVFNYQNSLLTNALGKRSIQIWNCSTYQEERSLTLQQDGLASQLEITSNYLLSLIRHSNQILFFQLSDLKNPEMPKWQPARIIRDLSKPTLVGKIYQERLIFLEEVRDNPALCLYDSTSLPITYKRFPLKNPKATALSSLTEKNLSTALTSLFSSYLKDGILQETCIHSDERDNLLITNKKKEEKFLYRRESHSLEECAYTHIFYDPLTECSIFATETALTIIDANGTELFAPQVEGKITQMAATRNSVLLLSTCAPSKIWAWDIGTHRPMEQIPSLYDAPDKILPTLFGFALVQKEKVQCWEWCVPKRPLEGQPLASYKKETQMPTARCVGEFVFPHSSYIWVYEDLLITYASTAIESQDLVMPPRTQTNIIDIWDPRTCKQKYSFHFEQTVLQDFKIMPSYFVGLCHSNPPEVRIWSLADLQHTPSHPTDNIWAPIHRMSYAEYNYNFILGSLDEISLLVINTNINSIVCINCLTGTFDTKDYLMDF